MLLETELCYMNHEPAVPRGHLRKFHRPWKGPFGIVRVLGPTVYRIQDCTHPRREKVMHFNRLKPISDLNVPSCSGPDDVKSTSAAAPPTIAPPTTSILNNCEDEEYELVALPLVDEQSSPQIQQPLRRSARARRPPDRYGMLSRFQIP